MVNWVRCVSVSLAFLAVIVFVLSHISPQSLHMEVLSSALVHTSLYINKTFSIGKSTHLESTLNSSIHKEHETSLSASHLQSFLANQGIVPGNEISNLDIIMHTDEDVTTGNDMDNTNARQNVTTTTGDMDITNARQDVTTTGDMDNTNANQDVIISNDMDYFNANKDVAPTNDMDNSNTNHDVATTNYMNNTNANEDATTANYLNNTNANKDVDSTNDMGNTNAIQDVTIINDIMDNTNANGEVTTHAIENSTSSKSSLETHVFQTDDRHIGQTADAQPSTSDDWGQSLFQNNFSPVVSSSSSSEEPTCIDTSCKDDCSIHIRISPIYPILQIGNTTQTWEIHHDLVLVTLIPGRCQIDTIHDFDITTAKKGEYFNAYLRTVKLGVMIVGLLGPGLTMDMKAILPNLQKSLGMEVPASVLNRNSAVPFVGMIGFPTFVQYKVITLEGDYASFWSTNVMAGNPQAVNMTEVSLTALENKYPSVTSDIGWLPPDCLPRSHIAIIIPFRGRDAHLHIFLNNIIPFLQRQLIAFKIFIIDQSKPELFNRGALMNIGYMTALKQNAFDCYVFHDVDLLPEDACNLYSCSNIPRHLSGAVNTLDYSLPYEESLGGAVILNNNHMQAVNGFSNNFLSPGEENDDMHGRLKRAGLDILRYPLHISRYTEIQHDPNDGSTQFRRTQSQVDEAVKYSPFDGLNSMHYKVEGITETSLYTKVSVNIPGPTTTIGALELRRLKLREYEALLTNLEDSG